MARRHTLGLKPEWQWPSILENPGKYSSEEQAGGWPPLAAASVSFAARVLAYYGDSRTRVRCIATRLVEGESIPIYFDHASSGLAVRGDVLAGFEIAGVERQVCADLSPGGRRDRCTELVHGKSDRDGWQSAMRSLQQRWTARLTFYLASLAQKLQV